MLESGRIDAFPVQDPSHRVLNRRGIRSDVEGLLSDGERFIEVLPGQEVREIVHHDRI